MQGRRIIISLIRPDQSMHVRIDPDLTEYGGNLISFAHGERSSKLYSALIQHGLGLIFLDAIPQFIYFSRMLSILSVILLTYTKPTIAMSAGSATAITAMSMEMICKCS